MGLERIVSKRQSQRTFSLWSASLGVDERHPTEAFEQDLFHVGPCDQGPIAVPDDVEQAGAPDLVERGDARAAIRLQRPNWNNILSPRMRSMSASPSVWVIGF